MLQDIVQPEFLTVDETLRLRKYDGLLDCAFGWYQDPDMLWMLGGSREPYPPEKVERMYAYLEAHGELYYIEVLEGGLFRPIGDVAFWPEDIPITIGEKAWRGKGIGRKVVSALVKRAAELGYSRIYVSEIYDWNTASRKCFAYAGFQAVEKTERGSRYARDLP